MNEKNVNDLLFRYVNGELSEEETRQVRDRCTSDPDYARELALTQASLRLLKHHKPLDPNPFFWTRLSTRLDMEEFPWQAWVWVAKRLIPSLVVATLLVTTAIWYQQPLQTSTSNISYEMELLAIDNSDIDEKLWSKDISKETLLQSAIFED